MKIKLDENHWLISDGFCYWITCLVKPENKKEYETRVSGYMPNFALAVESYINKSVCSSTATSLTKLKKDIEKIKQTVKGWEDPKWE